MKKILQINNWVIKEKNDDEIPLSISLTQRYCVFAPNGRFMEDNLTLQQAINFCNDNEDYVKGMILKHFLLPRCSKCGEPAIFIRGYSFGLVIISLTCKKCGITENID